MATFVLIHGAGDVGWYWHRTEAELQARGHQTIAPDLPCDNETASLDDYVGAVADAAAGQPDLVIAGQSYGAFTATLAASRLPARLLVLLAGMIPSPAKPRANGGPAPATSTPSRSRPGSMAARPATTTRSSPTTTEYRARWPRRPCNGAGAESRQRSGTRPGRWMRGRTCPPSSFCARTTSSSPPTSCDGWRSSAWAPSRTRFPAVTAPRSATPGN